MLHAFLRLCFRFLGVNVCTNKQRSYLTPIILYHSPCKHGNPVEQVSLPLPDEQISTLGRASKPRPEIWQNLFLMCFIRGKARRCRHLRRLSRYNEG